MGLYSAISTGLLLEYPYHPLVCSGILIFPHHDYGYMHINSTLTDSFFVRKPPVQMDYSCQGLLLEYDIDTSLPTHSSLGMWATLWHEDKEDKCDMEKVP